MIVDDADDADDDAVPVAVFVSTLDSRTCYSTGSLAVSSSSGFEVSEGGVAEDSAEFVIAEDGSRNDAWKNWRRDSLTLLQLIESLSNRHTNCKKFIN